MTHRDRTQDLVEQAKAGDRQAFDVLVRSFEERLRSSVERWARFQLGPRVDLDDVLQDTYVRAYRSLSRFEWQGSDSFFRWLCGVAKRALAQAAQDARKAPNGDAAPPPQHGHSSPSGALRRQERFDRLEEALERLSPDHREVIRLCRIDGLTSGETAERMGRSPEAVRQLLVRALRELKERFGDTESLHLPDRQLRFREETDET